jgi:hypothetical protein
VQITPGIVQKRIVQGPIDIGKAGFLNLHRANVNGVAAIVGSVRVINNVDKLASSVASSIAIILIHVNIQLTNLGLPSILSSDIDVCLPRKLRVGRSD